jgi:hypothetical protein
MMKRKADDSIDGAKAEDPRKRTAIDHPVDERKDYFRESLFGQKELDELIKRYSNSKPCAIQSIQIVNQKR